ncbi:hypothetical protein EXIGLDRAFT_126659 [Exidia glandulosa HHB12029]|uniref:Uncharacterized protein n=1 Tax=Exidia glandulosa HHB12029 TaxID=1314781 RepID=A0A165G9M4_EXIGL|nr:hypothetical protein EXIGLDRAFT_126659 [Exidia glandulosa HHB12029]
MVNPHRPAVGRGRRVHQRYDPRDIRPPPCFGVIPRANGPFSSMSVLALVLLSLGVALSTSLPQIPGDSYTVCCARDTTGLIPHFAVTAHCLAAQVPDAQSPVLSLYTWPTTASCDPCAST